MGNILCKESPRRVYVKSPVNGNRNTATIFGQQQIHPNSLTNIDGASPKSFNAKTNFFHSTPNLTNGQTKSTVSLDARIFDSGNYRTPPIAPPRKKRSTMKKGSTLPTTLSDDGVVRNGFKDVFTNGGGVSRALSYDEVEREQNVVQTRADVEENHKETTLERKLRVGNKKTDKFFGESLSDHLSDEPVEEPKKPVHDEVDRSSTSEMKLFFLMNMLDHDREDLENYKGMEPIEEPLFVARKKEIKKHVCDDDDHMHAKFHHHEAETCDHVAPPKPDRDFSKYQGNVENVIEQEKCEDVKARVKKAISRENLPTPPETPKRKSGIISLPGTPTITIENIDFNTPNDAEKDEKIQKPQVEGKIVKRPPALNISKASKIDQMMQEDALPQTPIIKHNIVDQIVKKAYGLHNYHPEDSEHNHDDGSNLVAPTSKLTTRKISVGRKISSESSPSFDGDFNGKSNELRSPDLVRQGCESPRTPPKSPMMSSKLCNASSMNDILEEIYSKNSEIMQEFQSYLEASIEKEPTINVDEEKSFLEKKGIEDNEFVCKEPLKHVENEDDNEDAQSFSDSFESTDNEQETVTEMNKIQSKFPRINRRRESIEDVDGWFNNHLDLEEKKSQLTNSRDSLPTSSTYDTQKTFPFGPTITGRRESLSDEFFTEIPQSLLKSHIDTVKESDSSSEDEREDVDKIKDIREKSPDHSTLLKYFDKGTKDFN